MIKNDKLLSIILLLIVLLLTMKTEFVDDYGIIKLLNGLQFIITVYLCFVFYKLIINRFLVNFKEHNE